MPREHRHLVGNPDRSSKYSHHRVSDHRPDLQQQNVGSPRNELRGIPASDPAELAGYAEAGESGDADTEPSYVDLGFADDTPTGGDVDEFGSAGPDDHIELDAELDAA